MPSWGSRPSRSGCILKDSRRRSEQSRRRIWIHLRTLVCQKGGSSMRHFVSPVVLLLVLCTGAAAATCWHYESKLDHRQYASTDVRIDDDGIVKVSSMFSNGKKIDGDTFVARVIVFDRENNPLIGFQYRKGVNAAGLGGARERRISESGKLDHTVKSKVDWVGVLHFQVDKVPDKAVVGELVGAAAGFSLGSKLAGKAVSTIINSGGKESSFQPTKGFKDLPKAVKRGCPRRPDRGGGGRFR